MQAEHNHQRPDIIVSPDVYNSIQNQRIKCLRRIYIILLNKLRHWNIEIANLDYRPSPSNMALSRVPGDDELYVGG